MRVREIVIFLMLTLCFEIPKLAKVSAESIAPPLVSATLNGTSVVLSFASTSKVSGYEVGVIEGLDKVKVIYSGSKTSTTVQKLAYGSTVVFTVRSYVIFKKERTYSNTVSVQVKVILAAPNLVGKLNKSVATLTWKKVIGAKGYEIFCSKSYVGDYKLVKVTTYTKFTEKLGVGVKYYYKIRSFVSVLGKKVYSDFSPIVLISY